MGVARDAPLPRRQADALAVEVERDPEEQDDDGDAGHGAVRVDVAQLVNPGVGIEGQEEGEAGWEIMLDVENPRIRLGNIGTGLHLNAIMASVASPTIGRYTSMTYTKATFVPCTRAKFTMNSSEFRHITVWTRASPSHPDGRLRSASPTVGSIQ